MSEDKKETSEPHLGLQSCLQPGFGFEKRWHSGVSVTSTEEFDRFTVQLAQTLLKTYSPEHIATIAAQRIILLDMTQSVLEKNEANKDDLAQRLVEICQKSASLAVCMHKKTAANKRMARGLKPRAEHRALIAAEIKRHAKELWDADTRKEYRVKDMARLVKDIVERSYPGETPSIERIRVLIKDFAPHHARQSGAPKGRRTPSKP